MHFIERPPLIYRWLFGKVLWRMPARDRKYVYLTFDDGPVPDVTPWVLDVLRDHNVKATFFMVGQNVLRYPELIEKVREEGHSIGNHSLSHMQGIKNSSSDYITDVLAGAEITASNIFRPPHGLMKPSQITRLKKFCRIVMYDLVSRDYSSRLSPDKVFNNIQQFTRDGSIIVFHDSVKAWPNLRITLPRAIKWLKKQGYEFGVIQ